MKNILGIFALMVGAFGNLLVFTKTAGRVLVDYNIDMIYIVILSVLSIFIGVYNVGRRSLIMLNVISILLNIIFLFYLYY